MLVLGGDKAWKTYRFRDLGVAFHWINDEPSLCLFPINPVGKITPYVLPLDSLHQIVIEGEKVDGRAVIECGMRAAHVMGRTGDFQFSRNCADAILNFAGELLRMPPTPDWILDEEAKKAKAAARAETGVAGEIEIKIDGQTVYQGEA